MRAPGRFFSEGQLCADVWEKEAQRRYVSHTEEVNSRTMQHELHVRYDDGSTEVVTDAKRAVEISRRHYGLG